MSAPFLIRVLTLFPEMFPGPLAHSLMGKAAEAKLWHLETLCIRDFAKDRHRTVDDTPFGGGAGMVMKPDVVHAALSSLTSPTAGKDGDRLICLSPRGRPFDQALAQELAAAPSLTFLCARYEGVDQRVIDHWRMEEISLGDFVLAGGEVAAMAMTEACLRLRPGVLGNEETVREESFAQGLLEYPHYTRPALWEGHAVPEILLSGHHEKVSLWREAESYRLTALRRPDLAKKYDENHTLNRKQKKT